MAQPNSGGPITSTPSVPGQPYDAADNTDRTTPWVKLEENAGPASITTGAVTGEFPDSGVWRQV